MQVEDILARMGEVVRLLVWSWPDEDGTDIDCAISDPDPTWPLRISKASGRWRVVQKMHYDYGGWYWILDHAGEVIAIDALNDPLGLGRDGFSTDFALNQHEFLPPAHVRAAYFTLKRLRKRDFSSKQWTKIKDAAATDPIGYRKVLIGPLGSRNAELLTDALRGDGHPNEILLRKLARAQKLRRFRSPNRAIRGFVVGAKRWLERGAQPSGVVVEIVGPDGSGKSTLAGALPEACYRLFRRSAHFHWRPHLLPAPGRVVGRSNDPTEPHARPPRSKPLSAVFLMYYWLDFVVGGWIRYRTLKSRSALVIVERGWGDIAVDPGRYRLDVPSGLVKALGKLVPGPDATIFLEAPAAVTLTRKQELTEEEIELQNVRWRQFLEERRNVEFFNAADPAEQLVGEARESIVRFMEDRCMTRLSFGWTAIPSDKQRWLLPRGPRRAARESLRLHHPITTKGRAVWESARLLGGLGVLRAFPRSGAIEERLRAKLTPYIPAGGTVAVAAANHPDRYIALMLDRTGEGVAIVKVDFDPQGRLALEAEAKYIESLGPLLAHPLYAPTNIDRNDGLLVFEATRWRPRERTWQLPADVAAAAGKLFATDRQGDGSDMTGPAHGDFAPWNLLRTDGGWMLIDWEDAGVSLPPFFDVFHFLVQTHVLLGRPSYDALKRALDGEGESGAALVAYAEAAGLALESASGHFVRYLELSRQRFDPATQEGRIALQARQNLLSSYHS